MREQEMLNILVAESREHLQRVEPQLLELERLGPAAPADLLNSIFRAVHSIKGGFGFFSIQSIVRLAHAMESVMARVRDGKQAIVPELVDALLRGIDKLNILVGDAAHADQVPIDQEFGALQPFLTRSDESRIGAAAAELSTATIRPAPAPPPATAALPAPLPQEEVDKALRNGKRLYAIALDPAAPAGQLDTWRKYGDVLRSDRTSIVFASVLEPDLVLKALKLAPASLQAVETRRPSSTQTMRLPQAPVARGAPEKPAEEYLRVRVGLLNRLMNLAGELVLGRNQMLQALGRRLSDTTDGQRAIAEAGLAVRHCLETHSPRLAAEADLPKLTACMGEAFGRPVAELAGIARLSQHIDQVTTALQESILLTRMQPVSLLFDKFQRVVRDLARQLGKEILLRQEGSDVELDKSILELLSDPLTHLVRNCVDHGIETPAQREAAGKPRQGGVWVRASHESGKVVVVVQDDGRGIDTEAVRRAAVERGVLSADAAAAMSQRELQALIFMPGFTTAGAVSEVSGRGVGMDVVKTNVERLGGTVEVESQPGAGTLVTLRLPLTLAIVPSLVVSAERRRFAIPQAALEEVVRVKGSEFATRIERVHRYEVLRLREKLLPLLRLTTVLGLPPTFAEADASQRQPDRRGRWSDRRASAQPAQESAEDAERRSRGERRRLDEEILKVVVLRLDARRYGLVVDEVHDNEEIVVKPLPLFLRDARCFAGATIMGDGSVAMILDPAGIADMAGLRPEELDQHRLQVREDSGAGGNAAGAPESELLLFTLGGPERLAVDLSSVARVEKRAATDVESVGDAEFVRTGGAVLRLVRLEDFLPLRRAEKSADSLFVLVPREGRAIAFRAAQVADTVRTRLVVEQGRVRGNGIRGTAVVNGHLTVLLDLAALAEVVRQRHES